jgi:hypothetical protein
MSLARFHEVPHGSENKCFISYMMKHMKFSRRGLLGPTCWTGRTADGSKTGLGSRVPYLQDLVRLKDHETGERVLETANCLKLLTVCS